MNKKHTGNLEQEIAALLKILQLGTRQIETANVEPAATVIARLRRRRPARPRLPD